MIQMVCQPLFLISNSPSKTELLILISTTNEMLSIFLLLTFLRYAVIFRKKVPTGFSLVKLFVTPEQSTAPNRAAAEQFIAAAGLSLPRKVGNFSVARNPNAVPRAFVTYQARRAPEVDKLLARLSDPRFDPLVASYVEGDFALANEHHVGHEVRIVRDEMTVVEIDAELQAPGLLVLADSYYAGWTASVDDEPVTIYATNHLFRGVPVAAGRHRVRFEFRPVSVWSGAALSTACALLWGGATFWVRRRHRAPPASP